MKLKYVVTAHLEGDQERQVGDFDAEGDLSAEQKLIKEYEHNHIYEREILALYRHQVSGRLVEVRKTRPYPEEQ